MREDLVAAMGSRLLKKQVILGREGAVVGGGREALEMFDACVVGGRRAKAVGLSVHEASWLGWLSLWALPLLALGWMARVRVRVAVDDRDRTVVVSRRMWFGEQTIVHRLEDVGDVLVDEDSSSAFGSRRLLIELRLGPRIPFATRIPLTDRSFSFTRRSHARAAARLQDALAAARDAVPEGDA